MEGQSDSCSASASELAARDASSHLRVRLDDVEDELGVRVEDGHPGDELGAVAEEEDLDAAHVVNAVHDGL